MNNLYTHTLYVSGMHCAACKHLIEDTFIEDERIVHASVSLSKGTVSIDTTYAEPAEALAERLTERVREHGYEVSVQQPVRKKQYREWVYVTVAALCVVAGLVVLEKTGVVSRFALGGATLGTAFFVGLVASVSTCLAVVGGLVLSVSATYAYSGTDVRPQVLFHVGRIGGFFVLGGLLGMLGETMQLSVYGSTLLGVCVSVVMLFLGIHLLDIIPGIRTLTLPAGFSRFFINASRNAGSFAPLLLGAITFFLPCGFTQSMQVMALSSGSVMTGALTMLMFSLGTLPVLALLTFGSFNLAKHTYRSVFFKAAGMLVILFALFNLQNALIVFGVTSPLIHF